MEIMDSSRVMAPEDQLREAMIAAGILTPPDEIIMDGSIRRFSTEPGNRNDTAGWYVAYGDGVPAGSFGDWRTGIKQAWYAKLPRDLTIEERKQQEERVTQARKEREAYLKEKQLQAHIECTDIFDDAKPAPADHPYLVKKGIKPHTARISAHGDLILPLKVVTGHIVSLQYIQPDGTKRFHKGSSTKEGMEILGKMTQAHRIFICEGYATGATIYEKTGMPVIVAYSAGNLDTVARIMKVEVPDAEFMIVADNDESGVGQAKAAEAGAKNNMQVIIPPVVGDVNDYAQAGGDITALLMPKKRYSTLAEFCLAPAPINWLIRNWVQAVGLSMVHGASGSGKTFVVLDWLMHIATGKPEWQGHKVKQGGVVYLAGEGHNGLKGRMAAWLQHYQVDPDGVPMIVTHGATDLDDRNKLQEVINDIDESSIKPSIIAVDTLHRFMSGDENSAMDTKVFLESCAILQAKYGCAVLLVHHTGVNAEAQHRARGSSAWKGALDGEFSVVQERKQIHLIQRKIKDADLSEKKILELQSVPVEGWIDDEGELVKGAVVVEAQEIEEISKQDKDTIDMLVGAWEKSGKEFEEEFPLITRDGWEKWLKEQNPEIRPSNLQRKFKLSDDTSTVSRLLRDEMIQQCERGYQVLDVVTQTKCVLKNDQRRESRYGGERL